jgi:FkbM family methyltransferase
MKNNPFSFKSLPWLAKLYNLSMTNGWLNKPGSLIFYIAQHFPIDIKGKYSIRKDEKNLEVEFNAKNTQYSSIYMDIFRNGYEPEVLAMLDRFVTKNSIFYDIGSNFGYFSLYVSTKKNFFGHVYAFEPFPSTFQDLKSGVSQLGLDKNVHCYQLALSDRVGSAQMEFSGLLHSGFAYVVDHKKEGNFNPSALTLTETIDNLKLKPPTIMKIDAQFYEYKILLGAVKTISKFHPLIIMESCLNFKDHLESLQPLLWLEKMGYKLYFPVFKDKLGNALASEADRNNYSSDKFELVPIRANQRFLFRDTINVLACYKGRFVAKQK